MAEAAGGGGSVQSKASSKSASRGSSAGWTADSSMMRFESAKKEKARLAEEARALEEKRQTAEKKRGLALVAQDPLELRRLPGFLRGDDDVRGCCA